MLHSPSFIRGSFASAPGGPAPGFPALCFRVAGLSRLRDSVSGGPVLPGALADFRAVGFLRTGCPAGLRPGLAAVFFSGLPCPDFPFQSVPPLACSAIGLVPPRACSTPGLSHLRARPVLFPWFAPSRVTGAGRFSPGFRISGRGLFGLRLPISRAVGFLRTDLGELRPWAGCRPFTRPRVLFSRRVGRFHRCRARVSVRRACREWQERQVLRVRVSGPKAGGRYRRIQLSSAGLSRKASRRALSSGRIYPSAAATSTSASRLQRLWFLTPASRRRSSPRCIP